MQLIGQILEQMPADAAGWLAVVAGLAALALLVRLGQAREDARQVSVQAPVAAPLEPGTDWQRIMDVSLVELTRAPDLHSIQERAAMQIDAAEHAFNRLLAECARVSTPIVSPSLEPVRELPREEAKAPLRQQPLAA